MFLVDTNVISELVRPRPDSRLLAWAELQPSLVVSAVTLEEVAYGFARRPNAALEARLEVFFDQHCERVPVDEAIARRAGALRGQLAARGQVRTQADMLIAATAIERRVTLATRNVRDFAECGVRLHNPFARG